MDFKLGSVAVGEKDSELRLPHADIVPVMAKVAALLPENRNDSGNFNRFHWHIEKARIADSREVPVEVIVNGQPVATQNIVADGKLRYIMFYVKIDRSSWVALRILPSSHTNPIFVLVGDKPIRASKRSVEWCLKGVDQCWSQKQRFIAQAEMEDAKAAYDHARDTYRKILGECEVE